MKGSWVMAWRKKLVVIALFFWKVSWSLASDGISVSDVYARATPPGAQVGVVYLSIANTAMQSDQLLKAETALAGFVEVHTHQMVDGVAQMREIKTIEVPAHGKVQLRPGGYHLMLLDLQKALVAGDTFPLTLKFAKAGTITAVVRVRPLRATP